MDRAAVDFLAYLRDDRSRSPFTVARYGDTLRRLFAFARDELHGEAIGPDDVDKAIVVAFVREPATNGARPSPGTRNARLSAVRAFYKWLLAERRATRDPTAGVERARLPKRSPTFLTFAEFEKLADTAERTASEHYLRRDLAILVTLFHTGLRLRELLSIDLAQVDFGREEFLHVRRKGGDVVNVVANVHVTIALRRWLWERKRFPNAERERALFLSDRGRRLSPRAVEELVAKYAGAASLGRRVTPHTLRHSYTTELLRRGVRLEVVGRLLNHKSLETTRTYVHVVGEELHAAANTLTVEPKRRRTTLAA